MSDELKILSVEEILDADDLPTKTVPTPEWGGAVVVKAMSLGQFQDVSKAAQVNGEPDPDKVTRYTLMAGIESPKFTEDQLDRLMHKSVAPLTRIMEAIAELSATGTGAATEAEAAFPEAA